MKTPNVNLTPILKKYLYKKLFKKEQYVFKEEFFRELFDPMIPIDYSRRTTLFINTVICEEGLPYLFAVRTELEGSHKGEKYWYLYEVQSPTTYKS